MRRLIGGAWPISWLLFAIVMGAMLPLGAYISNILVGQANDADEEARELALSTASAAAVWTREKLRTAETVARTIAERPKIGELDPSGCDALLGGILALFQHYGNVSVVDRERRFVCSALPPADANQRVPLHGGLRAAFAGRFGVSEPLVGVLPAKLVVSAAHPVRDASGAITGAVTIPIALAALQPIDDPAALPRGARVRVIDGNGVLLASSAREDPDLGRNLRGTKSVDLAMRHNRGTTRVREADGVEYIVGFSPVGLGDWWALAELPASDLLAKARARTELSALLGGLALTLALLSAWIITRHIARSLHSLAAAMAAHARNPPAHAALRGPADIRKLAGQFNSMVDERMRAGAVLMENEARLRLAVNAAGIGAWDWDIRNAGIYLSPEWKRQLGFEDHEFPSSQDEWRARLHPAEEASVMAGLVQFLKSDATSYECEYRLRAKDDSYRYVYSRAEAVRAPGGEAIRMIGAHIDVTTRRQTEDELKRALAQMRGLSMRIVEVEDSERRHISRELHDRIGGNIAALQISLSMLADNLARGDTAAVTGMLHDAREVVSATSSEVRTLMTELRPAALDDFGLPAPLRTYAMALGARVGLELTFSAPDTLPRAKPAVETAFFRIAQEALTNIAKHAQAQNVHIELSESAGVLTLCVQDDGVGFDKALLSAGQGLRNMRERADAIGAALSVDSSGGEGTRITVEVKL